MTEWLVEDGIGEQRAIRLENARIAEGRVHWPDRLATGQVEDAVLVSRTSGAARGTLRFASGEEALVDGLPREAREGAPIRAVVTRAAMAETGRSKRARARPCDDAPRSAPSLAQSLEAEGHLVRVVRRFAQGDWNALAEEASEGVIEFAGGAIILSPTPGMTVIDIDGTLPARALALAAVPAIADAIGRLDLSGSIGIDFPTLPAKTDRRAVDDALARALAGWPHERTAMNGFGFVQLVARMTHPSLLHRWQFDTCEAAARLVLRRAEAVEQPGTLFITLNPGVKAAIRPEWEAQLARRSGRRIEWRVDPALAPQAGFAQAIA